MISFLYVSFVLNKLLKKLWWLNNILIVEAFVPRILLLLTDDVFKLIFSLQNFIKMICWHLNSFIFYLNKFLKVVWHARIWWLLWCYIHYTLFWETGCYIYPPCASTKLPFVLNVHNSIPVTIRVLNRHCMITSFVR